MKESENVCRCDLIALEARAALEKAAGEALFVRNLQPHEFVVLCVERGSHWERIPNTLDPHGLTLKTKSARILAVDSEIWDIILEKYPEFAGSKPDASEKDGVFGLTLTREESVVYELCPQQPESVCSN